MDSEYSLVSVGIPTYNRPDGLKRTLDCIINQTYNNLEIIISDNCSTDSKVDEVINSFCKNDKRIIYFKQTENKGPYYNFEFVLTKATGEFFMWAADDDIIDYTYIEKCLQAFHTYPEIILCSSSVRFVRDGKREDELHESDSTTIGLSKLERIKKIGEYKRKTSIALYGIFRTEFIRKVKLRIYVASDALFLQELCSYGAFHQIPEKLFTYDIRTNGDHVNMSAGRWKHVIEKYHLWPKYFLINHQWVTVFLFFILSSLRWKNLSFVEHLKVIGIIYRNFYGYNTLEPLNKCRSVFFYFKPRKIVAQYKLFYYNEWLELSVDAIAPYVHKILLLISDVHWGYDQYFKGDDLTRLLEKIKDKHKDKIVIYRNTWYNQLNQLNDGLEYIRKNIPETSHCLYIEPEEIYKEKSIKKLTKIIKTYQYYNRAIYINENIYFKSVYHKIKTNSLSKKLVLFPIRKLTKYWGKRKVNFGILNLDLTLDNFSFVRNSDEKVLRKIKKICKDNEQFDSWYRNIWLKWCLSIKEFHPCSPKKWESIISVDKSELQKGAESVYLTWKQNG